MRLLPLPPLLLLRPILLVTYYLYTLALMPSGTADAPKQANVKVKHRVLYRRREGLRRTKMMTNTIEDYDDNVDYDDGGNDNSDGEDEEGDEEAD